MSEHSNIRLRSNVYFRQGIVPITQDREFTKRVQGLKAIRKLLQMFGIAGRFQQPESPQIRQLVRQNYLTVSQAKALQWEIPCFQCQSIPCGETFHGTVEFRCPQRTCASRPRAQELLLPPALLKQMRSDPTQILERSLVVCKGKVPEINDFEPPLSRRTVRLNLEADYRFSKTELAKFLAFGIVNGL